MRRNYGFLQFGIVELIEYKNVNVKSILIYKKVFILIN